MPNRHKESTIENTAEIRHGAAGSEGAAPIVVRRNRTVAVLLALIVVLALTLRLAWVAFSDFQPTMGDDTGRYDFWARNLADGEGFVNYITGDPTAFGAPGYSITLGAVYFVTGKGIAAAQVLNVVLGIATVLLVYLLATRMAGNGAGLLAAFLIAVSPSNVIFASLTMGEVLSTLVLLAALLLIVWESESRQTKWPQTVALGLLLGYGGLIRGEILLLPLVALVFWRFSGMNWSLAIPKCAVVVALMALVISPWIIRNWVRMGAPVLTTHSGVTLWVGHHPGADGRFEFADELISRHPELPPTEHEVRVNNDGVKEALDYAFHNPLDEIRLFGQKLYWMYADDEEALRWNEAHGERLFLDNIARNTLLILSNAHYFAILALFVAGAGIWFSVRSPALLLVLVVGYWTLAHIAFIGDSRYHFPIMPLLTICAAAAAVSVTRTLLSDKMQPSLYAPATRRGT